MKNRVAIIRPFFQGHFINYFQLFLESCKNNPEFDWIIFTDNQEEYDYPTNVHKIYMSFEEAKKLVRSKFDFNISLERPYKLCDYKAAYGYIFSEYLEGYDFWGHTDYDVIYGRLGRVITDEMLDKYDKLFVLGHLTFYRNTDEITTLFMKEIQGRFLYKEVMQSAASCNFDEDWNGVLNINDIFRQEGKRIYENPENESLIADIYVKSSDFRVTYQKRGEWKDIVEKRKRAIFAYVDGKLVRYEMVNHQLTEQEYLYIHLQKRRMELKPGVLESGNYLIIPNAFVPLKEPITVENFRRQRVKYCNLHYFRIRWSNLKTKVKRYFS